MTRDSQVAEDLKARHPRYETELHDWSTNVGHHALKPCDRSLSSMQYCRGMSFAIGDYSPIQPDNLRIKEKHVNYCQR